MKRETPNFMHPTLKPRKEIVHQTLITSAHFAEVEADLHTMRKPRVQDVGVILCNIGRRLLWRHPRVTPSAIISDAKNAEALAWKY